MYISDLENGDKWTTASENGEVLVFVNGQFLFQDIFLPSKQSCYAFGISEAGVMNPNIICKMG